MGLIGCLLRFLKLLLFGVLLLYIMVYLCPVGPCCKRYKTNLSNPCPEFIGPLTRNNHLDAAQRVFENKIGFGPQAIEFQNGFFYAGTADGQIFKFKDNKLEKAFSIGSPNCVPVHLAKKDDEKCGSPLGMRFDSRGDIVVADWSKGIYKVIMNTGKNVTLVPISVRVDGVKISFPEDLDVTKNGDIYFADASSSWSFDYPMWLNMLTPQPNGRILHYNPVTKQVKTVLDHLYFPTGIQLSPEEDFLLFSQGFAANIMKYYLKGPNQGQVEILIDNLPGVVDNIRPSGRGTYWVPLVGVRVPWELSLWEKLDFCVLTKFIVYSAMEAVSVVFATLKPLIPLPIIETIHSTVQQYIFESMYQPSYGMILEFTSKGEILRSLHSPKGIVSTITQVTEHDGTLYLASAFNSFIGKLKLK